MFNQRRVLLVVMVAVMLLGRQISLKAPTAIAQSDNQTTCPAVSGDVDEPPVAKLYIEYNATDADLGIQGLADADGWSLLCVYDPDGNEVLTVTPQGSVREQLLSELFFEAAEPPLDEFGLEDLPARFPSGDYEFRYVLEDGIVASSLAVFTHAIPTPPVIVAPQLANEEDAEAISVDGLVVQWEPVTESTDGDAINIVGYQVMIVNEDYEDSNSMARPAFDVHVPSDRTSVTVSPEIFQPDTLYVVEVLAVEESGNQTISLGYFMTGDSTD